MVSAFSLAALIVVHLRSVSEKQEHAPDKPQDATPVRTPSAIGSQQEKSVIPATTAPRPVRKGLVRLDGRAFADGDGQYLAVGTSLFWALWGYQHDRQRLERHL